MLIAFVGGVGSGKTLSSAREVINNKKTAYCNFSVLSPYFKALKVSDLLLEEDDGRKSTFKVNWEFWENIKGDIDIYIDEVHNLYSSRRSMSHENVMMSQLVSQSRKLLGDKSNSNLVVISQKINKIDKDLRDLLHVIKHHDSFYQMDVEGRWVTIEKNKYINNYKDIYKLKSTPTEVYEKGKLVVKDLPALWIRVHEFDGLNCLENYDSWIYDGKKSYNKKYYFLANYFYKYYNTNEFVKDSFT